jgi:hypothetical protein
LGTKLAVLGAKIAFGVDEGAKVGLGRPELGCDLVCGAQKKIERCRVFDRTETKSFAWGDVPSREDPRLELLYEGFHSGTEG